MNQTSRDLTYRLDAVKAGCEMYGWESAKCTELQSVWKSQHAMNVRLEMLQSASWFLFILILLGWVVLLVWAKYLLYRSAKTAPHTTARPPSHK